MGRAAAAGDAPHDGRRRVATGDEVDLHDAVIAQERAALAFRLTLQVRNKLLEAYHELTRMQV
ncbi:MAG: flagellar hook-basal body complex protein FliE [Chloroflexi bacterium]|nr:flagellar hook-basal body complex protein FliE [Chloroflexota bacterium]